jgi:enoyl-CoA hydratase/carnithine racemase
MAYEDITVSHESGIASIAFSRAERSNALRPQTLEELGAALDEATADPAVKAIILRGDGKHFSAGADFEFLGEITQMSPPQIREQVYTRFQGAAKRLYRCPKPTVALIQGAAVTVACELALACDFRLMTPRAFLQESWVKLGIMPPLGGLFLLPRHLGLGRAMDLVLRGTKLDAQTAVATGLAHEVVEDEALVERGRLLAAELAEAAPLAYAAIKEAVQRGLETSMDFEWSANVSTQSMLLSSEDFGEGLHAAQERRRPAFRGR